MTDSGTVLPITLFSTTDMQSGREDDITRMLGSVEAFKQRNPGVDVTLFLLLQRCEPATAKRFIAKGPAWAQVSAIPDRRSLSAARNMLLTGEDARRRLVLDGIVAFPDDDCWYPEDTLDTIHEAFSSDPALDFWFCRYGMEPRSAASFTATQPRLQTVISFASSNTIFLRGALAGRIGGFDEQLGVGTALSGGEDTDYAMRAFQGARRAAYVDARCIGHRDPNKALKAKYYPGSLRAIAKNVRTRPSELQALGRKLLVGSLLAARNQMSWKDYFSALTRAFAG
ncbi:hypothetical protein ACO34A_20185 [Rhizobium sp. ACO-34A]|nr:glycosyltransferase family A protein [Rhizobium sp. ACO-34A]ATN36119.1 hypothetical protein ACO34A_20185 [Rhizobium sp. ACO-34A]